MFNKKVTMWTPQTRDEMFWDFLSFLKVCNCRSDTVFWTNSSFTNTSYLSVFVMAVFVFFVSLLLLHLLHLFVGFVSTHTHTHSHSHSHSCQTSSHGIYTSMMVPFVVPFFVTFMMIPFRWVWVGAWVNTSRRNSWISTWCHWISLGLWSAIRHCPRRCTWSHRRL